MASKLVTDREKSANAVTAVADTHEDLIGGALDEVFKPHLKMGETMPEFSLVTALIGRLLRRRADDMVTADLANEAELRDDDPTRQQRDRAADMLSTQLVGLREAVTGSYGPEFAHQVFAGPLPPDAMAQVRFAEQVADALEQATVPAPRFPGMTLQITDIAHTLREQAGVLERCLIAVAHEAREAQATLVAKDRAIAAYDRGFGGAAGLLASLLAIADQPELAERVRPSRSRPGRTVESERSAPDATTDATTDV